MSEMCSKQYSVLIFIVFILNGKAYGQVIAPLDFAKSFDGNATGVIRTIDIDETTIWLGAENGLFGIVGSKVTYLNSDNSPLKTNYISDIAKMDAKRILLAAFGDGLYILDKRSKNLSKLSVEGIDTRSVWAIDVSNDYIAVSTIRDIYVIDKKTNKLLVSFSSLSPNSASDIRSLAIDGNYIWWLDITKGLRRLDLNTNAISYYARSSYFSKATYLTALYIEKEHVYIGSDENVYQFDKHKQSVTRLLTAPASLMLNPQTTVFKLLRDKAGIMWVAADRLYQLNEQELKLESPDLLYPLLASRTAELVLDFFFDNNGNLFAADTQRGLFTIPAKAGGIEFLGGNLSISAAPIHDISLSRNSTIYFTGEGTLTKYSKLRESTEYSLASKENSFIISHSDNLVTLITRSGIIKTINTISGQKRDVANLKEYYGRDVVVKDAVSGGGASLFILIEGTTTDQIIKWNEEKVTVLFEGSLHKMTIRDSHTLVVSSLYDGIYQISENDSKISVDKISTHLFSGLSCLYQDKYQRLWVCGDGEGLYYLNEQNQLKKLANFRFQYIRGITEVDNEKYLIATNSGLFIYDFHTSTYTQIGEGFGIDDVDFEYDALHSNDKSIVIIGDNYSYLIDKELFSENLVRYQYEEIKVEFTGLNVYDTARESLESASQRLLERTDGVLKIARSERMFEIELVVADYIESDASIIEYRLLGEDENWLEANRSIATVSFSSLPHGDYELQARVKSEYRATPVSSLFIHVAPPWWLTVYAIITYIVVLLLFLTYLVWLVRRRRTVLSPVSSENLDEQHYSLDNNQPNIKMMLNRKHRVFRNVAREIQTPLALILGPLQYIQDNPGDEDNRRRIGVIARNALRLHMLINQMAEMEQLESSGSHPRHIYELKPYFPKLIANMEGEFARKGIQLATSFKATGSINLKPDSLEKVFYSLIKHAIAATPHGGEVSIDTRCESLHLVIRVYDSGRALSETEAANVFERFTQQKQASAEQWLPGLAIVKEAVLVNAGWIGIDSKPEQGNCVSVYLPLINFSAEMENAPPLVVNLLPRNPDIDNCRPVVLIAEDNPDMRQYMVDVLKPDYNCIEASNGDHALQIMQAITPHLVISDSNMPHCSGYELSEKMNASERLATIPFVLISEEQTGDVVKACEERDIDSFLIKPVNAAMLRYTAHKLMSFATRYHQEAQSIYDITPFKVPEFSNSREQLFYTRFINILAKRFNDEAFNKAAAASELAVSERQLSRKLQSLFMMSFSEILKQYRLYQAKMMLDEGRQVTQVAYDVGFSTLSYFSRSFKTQCNETPSQYQERIKASTN